MLIGRSGDGSSACSYPIQCSVFYSATDGRRTNNHDLYTNFIDRSISITEEEHRHSCLRALSSQPTRRPHKKIQHPARIRMFSRPQLEGETYSSGPAPGRAQDEVQGAAEAAVPGGDVEDADDHRSCVCMRMYGNEGRICDTRG